MNQDFTWMVRCKCVADIGNMVSGCTMGKIQGGGGFAGKP